jgi:hypothetical protein
MKVRPDMKGIARVLRARRAGAVAAAVVKRLDVVRDEADGCDDDAAVALVREQRERRGQVGSEAVTAVHPLALERHAVRAWVVSARGSLCPQQREAACGDLQRPVQRQEGMRPLNGEVQLCRVVNGEAAPPRELPGARPRNRGGFHGPGRHALQQLGGNFPFDLTA